MDTVLVTGASGLIGRAVVRGLADSHRVTSLGRCRASETHITANLSDRAFRHLLPQRIGHVIYLAQSEGYNRFPEQACDALAVNVDAAVTLLDWARSAGAKSFVLASSGGIYGIGPRPFRESDPPRVAGSLEFYFQTKLAAEALAQAYRRYFNVVIVRPFFVYGPGQNRDRWLPRLFARVRNREPITLSSEDGMRINPLHADDAAAAIRRCLDVQSGVINLAGPQILSMRQVGELIGGAIGLTPTYEASTEAEPGDLIADTTVMCDRLGAPAIHLPQVLTSLARDEGW